MATVKDLARPDDLTDPPLTKPNRENAGDPNGSLTPEFSGEIVLDTTNNVWYQAGDLTDDSWVQVQPPVY